MSFEEVVGLIVIIFFGGTILSMLLPIISAVFAGASVASEKLPVQKTDSSASDSSDDARDSDLTSKSENQLAAGLFVLFVASFGFVASAVAGGGRSFAGSILAGVLNPIFFLGLPLGLYLIRIGNAANESKPKRSRSVNRPSLYIAMRKEDFSCEPLARSLVGVIKKVKLRQSVRETESNPTASRITQAIEKEEVNEATLQVVQEPDENRLISDGNFLFGVLAVVVGFLSIPFIVMVMNSKPTVRTESTNALGLSPSQNAEQVMFALVTDAAARKILENVDRPFELEFGKPVVAVAPDEPTIATVLIECTHGSAGVKKSELFMVLLENIVSPTYASRKEQLNCLLVNAGGTVMFRDEDYWQTMPLDLQRKAGALDTETTPFVARKILDFQASASVDSPPAERPIRMEPNPPRQLKNPEEATVRDLDTIRKSIGERLWRDASGTYSVRATVVGISSTAVTLKKPNGKQINIDIAKLHPADRDFLWKNQNELEGLRQEVPGKGRAQREADVTTMSETAAAQKLELISDSISIRYAEGHVNAVSLGRQFYRTEPNPSCLSYLRFFPQLSSLSVARSGFTNEEIEMICEMKDLEDLSVVGVLTPDQMSKLRARLPNTTIHYSR